ncbi:hypothetical protein EP30_07115 [Bifidobacterium sp. UTCIF-39]|nr:hypothetical protein EP30_07115 [Bifidobacterium sp. UTCIF-39]
MVVMGGKQDRRLLVMIIGVMVLLAVVSFVGSLPDAIQGSAIGIAVQIGLCVFGAVFFIILHNDLYQNQVLRILGDILAVIGWVCVASRIVDLPISGTVEFVIRSIGQVLLTVLAIAQLVYLRKISKS